LKKRIVELKSPLWTVANKKRRERFLTTHRVGLKGEHHGWWRIKKHREQFLTTQRVGLKGEHHGWWRIKNHPKVVFYQMEP